jgi:hypothetical protein
MTQTDTIKTNEVLRNINLKQFTGKRRYSQNMPLLENNEKYQPWYLDILPEARTQADISSVRERKQTRKLQIGFYV